MKLFIQIPCLNEETTLPLVFEKMPKQIDGIDEIEFLVIDDGSTDKTVEVAKKLGVQHIIRHTKNRGLSRSFSDGADYAIQHGADIIVNTDGDNQYPSDKIPDIVKPILDGEADIVIGDRQTNEIAHFSPLKRLLQRLGSRIVNIAAGTDVADTVSGFRAYSKNAILQLYTINSFSYCTETIIHAGRKRIAMISVPVGANAPTRDSRLFKSTWQHVAKSGMAIIKGYLMYQPTKIFVGPGVLQVTIALILFARYIVLFISGNGDGHIQSLIVGTALIISGVLFIGLGIIADLIRTNRILLEDILQREKANYKS
jgi:glycosyltransferase involved in cell wall biosynthesis